MEELISESDSFWNKNRHLKVLLLAFIFVFIACGIALVMILQVEQHENDTINTSVPAHHVRQATTTPISIYTQGWATYTNAEYGFSFEYPQHWIISTSSLSATELLVLDSPDSLKSCQNGIPYCNQLSIYYSTNINNLAFLGDDWDGKRTYSSLDDYFNSNSQDPAITELGSLSLSGIKAYEIILGGMGENYGIVVENKGVYLLSFDSAWDKSSLNQEQKEIVSTFKFLK